MNLLEIACIVFSCVAAIHLELVAAIEEILHRRLPIVSCPKCCTFWAVLTWGCVNGVAAYGTGDVMAMAATAIKAVAVSFAAAWSAAWVELMMGAIDRLYLLTYGKIYPTAGAANANADSAVDALPNMRGEEASCDIQRKTAGDGSDETK